MSNESSMIAPSISAGHCHSVAIIGRPRGRNGKASAKGCEYSSSRRAEARDTRVMHLGNTCDWTRTEMVSLLPPTQTIDWAFAADPPRRAV
jgi:hypothetical protein